MSCSGWFTDAEFLSPDTGVYLQGYWCSPSSGGGFSGSRTVNGASTWAVSFGGSGQGVSSIAVRTCKKRNTFYILHNAMGATLLARSSNGGLSWFNNGFIGSSTNIFFPCDTNKFYSAYNYSGACHITKYDNGLMNNYYSSIPSVYPTGLFFPDTANGYLVATNGTLYESHLIYKTINGGMAWDTVLNDPSINIRNIYFTNVDHGYIIGDGGKIKMTNDSGTTWQDLNSGVSVNLNSLYFLTDSIGFIAGDSGIIIRTYDAGSSWTQDYTGTTNSFKKIYFVNDSIGFALIDGTQYIIDINNLNSLWSPQFKLNSDLDIFPNPSNGKCTITVPQGFLHEKNLVLSIFDSKGSLIQRTTPEMNDGKIKLYIETLVKGVYNVVLTNEKKNYGGKLVFE